MLFHALFVSHFPDSKREKMVSALAIFSCSEKLENIFERGCGDIVKKNQNDKFGETFSLCIC